MIEVIVEESGQVRRVNLARLPAIIGRSDDVEVPLDCHRVSRAHARIEKDGSTTVVRDLDSSNGTFRRGERVSRAVVQHGDRIEIGDAVLTFLLEAPVRATPPPIPTPDPAPDMPVGRIPGYSLGRRCGEGVLSSAYLATQEAMGRTVVVKVLHPRWQGDSAMEARFLRRARHQSKLRHSGVASGIDVGDADGVPHFIVECLEGESVAQRVARLGPLRAPELGKALESLLETVGWLHDQGILLARFQPEGVFLTESGECRLAAVGLPVPPAAFPREFDHQKHMWPPESPDEPERAGASGDLYQLGALGWFMASGGGPGEAPLPGGLPAPLQGWLRTMTATTPADRPASAREALRALPALRDGRDGVKRGAAVLTSSSESPGDQPIRAASPRRSARFVFWNRVLTAVIGIALNAGVFMWWQSRKNESPVTPPDPAPPVEIVEAPRPVSEVVLPPPDWESSPEWTALNTRVSGLLAEGRPERFEEALEGITSFSRDHAGGRLGELGRNLLQQVQEARRNATAEAVQRLTAHLDAGALDPAETAFAELTVLAPRSAERAALSARLETLRRDTAAARPVVTPDSAPSNGGATAEAEPATGAAPGPASSTPGSAKTTTDAEWTQWAEEAYRDPGAAAARRKVLDGGPRPGFRRSWRLVSAVDRAMGALVASLSGQVGQSLELQGADGNPVEGALVSVDLAGLRLKTADEEQDVPWGRLATASLVRMLSALPPGLDTYLTRGHLNLRGQEWGEAWFDFHGAQRLAGDDADARSLVEEGFEVLREKPGGK